MKRLCKLVRLSIGDNQLLIKTFVLLGLVRLGLWLLPFPSLRQAVAKLSHSHPKQPPIKQISVGKIIWAVNLSSRYMPGGVKCLARALTTQVFMSRQGYSPQLRIGVAKGEGGQLEAHAWVESQGQVVIGYLGNLSYFTPLPSLEG
ncbi:MAG: lasso peptide biosynthesis B2 protein [Symploca sp. SIO2B6]|nr:lasso peptide biosynthesis B2 protein [Symploca sp. SIO2B6]